MVWRPDGDALFASSHGGDIAVLRGTAELRYGGELCADHVRYLRRGGGKGCSVGHMHLSAAALICTSHNGALTSVCTATGAEEELWNTHDSEHWFTCAASSEHGCLLAADNKGAVHMFDSRTHRPLGVHTVRRSAKIGFIDCAGELFATGSNDKTCRVMDVRFVREARSYSSRSELSVYEHEGVVSCCVFSPTGRSLLTTAQNDELRVYDMSAAGELAPPRVKMQHPHKFYQHITPIKAVWHPLARDLVCVGRYADRRGVDLIDLSCDRVHNMAPRLTETIMCVNAFSGDGALLASGTSNSVFLWRVAEAGGTGGTCVSAPSCRASEGAESFLSPGARSLRASSGGSTLSPPPSAARRAVPEPPSLDFSGFRCP